MEARSHVCEFKAADVLRNTASLAGGVIVITLLLHVLAASGWLPAPAPADLERTILRTKARLAMSGGAADILLAGDSSCMMDADAVALGEQLGKSVLNLGTLSFLGVDSHAALVKAHARAHPASNVTVVLLMHPDALRRPSGVARHEDYLRALLEGRMEDAWTAPWLRVLGGGILKERVLQSWIPVMMPGAFGARYGDQFSIARSLRMQRGSLQDPGRFDPAVEAGSREVRLAGTLEGAARRFRASLPGSARLVAGITPVPGSLAASDHVERTRALLREWGEWLGADATLDELPMVWPDDRFASRAHLNPDGAREWTRALARALASHGPRPAR